MSNINFAIQSVQGAVTASVVGNMGASLRTGEFREADDDKEDIQFSRDPFNFGLIPEVDENEDDPEVLASETGMPGPSGCLLGLDADRIVRILWRATQRGFSI